jgi:protein-L-isoaspartate(D-aspartate) O-methyltransferase
MTGTLEDARRWFAEDVRIAAGIKPGLVLDAFARVPRENFIGPPPWRVGTRVHGAELIGYQTLEGDPCVLYHDVVVALDEERKINNGQPSLWAMMLAAVDPQPGECILHLGCGTGYYSAILAEIVGADGSVTAVEIDDGLAGRARLALSPWQNVAVVVGDGAEKPRNSYDGIIVSAGLTQPMNCWLDGLAPGGRLLFPLTMDGPQPSWGGGAMLLVTRTKSVTFAARFLGPAGFVHFRGGRDPDANQKLVEAFRTRFRDMAAVRSLRRDGHEQDSTCWLHGRDFCLSYRDPQ